MFRVLSKFLLGQLKDQCNYNQKVKLLLIKCSYSYVIKSSYTYIIQSYIITLVFMYTSESTFNAYKHLIMGTMVPQMVKNYILLFHAGEFKLVKVVRGGHVKFEKCKDIRVNVLSPFHITKYASREQEMEKNFTSQKHNSS